MPTRSPEAELVRDRERERWEVPLMTLDRCDVGWPGTEPEVASTDIGAVGGERAIRKVRTALNSLLLSSSRSAASSDTGIS